MPSNMMQALQSLQGFSALSEEALNQITPFASVRAVRTGETIFCQGEPSPYCFGVLAGEIVIQQVSKDSPVPPKVVGMIEAGELFGESALFENCTRSAMAMASKDGKLAIVQGEGLRAWLRKNPKEASPLLLALLKTTLERLHQTSQDLAATQAR